jgi:tetratricopeptide (TPR) repeat protein
MIMKKFFLLIAALSISFGVMAQKNKVTAANSYIDQGALDKAKEALDLALANESSANLPTTYFTKGKLAQATYDSKDPKFNTMYADPLQEAYAAYQKALELDPKGGIKKKILTGSIYNNLAVNLFKQGSEKFEAKDYAGALLAFQTQIAITEGELYVGVMDTGMYYNAGLAAVNSAKYDEAIKYFQKCADMKYMGITPYFQMSETYIAKGDTAQAETILKSVKDKFPNDKNVTLQLIDLYIKSGKNDNAQALLKNAKETDPNNYSLYFASGIIYLNENNYDMAIPDLQKSIELKGDVYDTQYGLGAAYINKAAEMFKKANDIMDVKKYSEAIDEANAVYAKALPYMEKALELKPDDVYAMRSLQELYYRLKQTDKYAAIKAKLDAIDKK